MIIFIVVRGSIGPSSPVFFLVSIKQSSVAEPTPTWKTGKLPGHPSSKAAPIESICTWLITILRRTPILSLLLLLIFCLSETATARITPITTKAAPKMRKTTLGASPGHSIQSKSLVLKYPGAPIFDENFEENEEKRKEKVTQIYFFSI